MFLSWRWLWVANNFVWRIGHTNVEHRSEVKLLVKLYFSIQYWPIVIQCSPLVSEFIFITYNFSNSIKVTTTLDLCMMRFRWNFTAKLYIITRQSISFTKPNDEWLKTQVEKEEYSSKSELVNDLIRQARKQHGQIDWIRAQLDKAESKGFQKKVK